MTKVIIQKKEPCEETPETPDAEITHKQGISDYFMLYDHAYSLMYNVYIDSYL